MSVNNSLDIEEVAEVFDKPIAGSYEFDFDEDDIKNTNEHQNIKQSVYNSMISPSSQRTGSRERPRVSSRGSSRGGNDSYSRRKGNGYGKTSPRIISPGTPGNSYTSTNSSYNSYRSANSSLTSRPGSGKRPGSGSKYKSSPNTGYKSSSNLQQQHHHPSSHQIQQSQTHVYPQNTMSITTKTTKTRSHSVNGNHPQYNGMGGETTTTIKTSPYHYGTPRGMVSKQNPSFPEQRIMPDNQYHSLTAAQTKLLKSNSFTNDGSQPNRVATQMHHQQQPMNNNLMQSPPNNPSRLIQRQQPYQQQPQQPPQQNRLQNPQNMPPQQPRQTLGKPTTSMMDQNNLNEQQKKYTISHYKKGDLIGQGANGRVYIALDEYTGRLFAAKEVVFGNISNQLLNTKLKEISMEIQLMKNLNHPNIVRYYGTHREKKTLDIFLEYISGGSLDQLIKGYGLLSEAICKRYTKQILLGLEYLHFNRIIHRDIKGANILIDAHLGVVKLADFGASRQINEIMTATSQFTTLSGTPNFMAPEVIKQTGHGRSADIWSVGCTLMEMYTGKPPFAEYKSVHAVMFHIASTDELPAYPDFMSDDAKDFLNMCFIRDPSKRATVNDLLAHKWLKDTPVPSEYLHNQIMEECRKEKGQSYEPQTPSPAPFKQNNPFSSVTPPQTDHPSHSSSPHNNSSQSEQINRQPINPPQRQPQKVTPVRTKESESPPMHKFPEDNDRIMTKSITSDDEYMDANEDNLSFDDENDQPNIYDSYGYNPVSEPMTASFEREKIKYSEPKPGFDDQKNLHKFLIKAQRSSIQGPSWQELLKQQAETQPLTERQGGEVVDEEDHFPVHSVDEAASISVHKRKRSLSETSNYSNHSNHESGASNVVVTARRHVPSPTNSTASNVSITSNTSNATNVSTASTATNVSTTQTSKPQNEKVPSVPPTTEAKIKRNKKRDSFDSRVIGTDWARERALKEEREEKKKREQKLLDIKRFEEEMAKFKANGMDGLSFDDVANAGSSLSNNTTPTSTRRKRKKSVAKSPKRTKSPKLKKSSSTASNLSSKKKSTSPSKLSKKKSKKPRSSTRK
mmetsp:Transcript_7427/g.10974  ORF Transcript_7427/g.10974 Transcript_7427/m.10974 type:complete len:1073 (+) Transcript_7427:65-3283(+)